MGGYGLRAMERCKAITKLSVCGVKEIPDVVRELSKPSGGGDPGIGPTFVWLIGTPHATNQLDN